MSTYTAAVSWQRGEQDFPGNRYSRLHFWRFDGGVEVRASSSPQVVPVPMSSEDAVDPEEAFVAALSSCHMLWFLAIAAKRGFVVDAYDEGARPDVKECGRTARHDERHASTKVRFSGEVHPSASQLDDLHNEAHDNCYLAHSVKAEVQCEPRS